MYGNLLQQQQETNTLDPGGHQGTRMSSRPFYIKNNEMTNCPHVSPQPCYTSGIKIHSVCNNKIKFIYLYWTHVQHVRSQFSDKGSNPHPLHWKHGILTTGLPGKPPRILHFRCEIKFFFNLSFNTHHVSLLQRTEAVEAALL